MGGGFDDASNDAQSSFGTEPVGAVSQSCSKPCRCDDTPTPIDPTKMCKSGCDYYLLRERDFRDRHTCPECKDAKPPDYYLSYGLKYCMRFSTVTGPTLSPEGQAWLARARCNLQVAMEKGLRQNPSLEQDSDAFRKFAFSTHTSAYLDAGLSDLSMGDQFKVLKTPDLTELKNLDTWKQAAQVAGGEAEDWLGGAWKTIKGWFDW
jgi:hypothetical protein